MTQQRTPNPWRGLRQMTAGIVALVVGFIAVDEVGMALGWWSW